MRIGLDARALVGRHTGDRTYWRGLIRGLSEIDPSNIYLLFTRSQPNEEDVLELPPNFESIILPAFSERSWSLLDFSKALKRYRVDVAHTQYTVSPFLPCRSVTTVHDISFRLFPDLFSWKDRVLLNMSVPSSMKRADAVITVSESSRRDILTAYPFIHPEKITATPLSVDHEFKPIEVGKQASARRHLAANYGLTGEFVLSVGVLQPRKNLPLLIEAFTRAKRRGGLDITLAIVGKIGWLSAETEDAILRAGTDVRMLGYVPDQDLPFLYGCANVMAYPSLYEGFGLPALEAMACGCPVVVSNNSSLPEVVGEAGILLKADNLTDWEETLIDLTENASKRSKMRLLGLDRAAQFSWSVTAQKTLEVYERIAKGK